MSSTTKPEVLPESQRNFQNLLDTMQQHINELDVGHDDEDAAQYIYEAALQAFYGPDIFKWINSKIL